MNKQYYAVLCGYPDASEGELVDYLRKEGSVAVAVTGREKNFPDAKIAKLHYSILEKINQPMPLALADVCIETGRFHQIRVQFAHAGWPLLGDTKYGNTTVAGTAGVRHIAAWHFAHILWILPIPATAKRCHSG